LAICQFELGPVLVGAIRLGILARLPPVVAPRRVRRGRHDAR